MDTQRTFRLRTINPGNGAQDTGMFESIEQAELTYNERKKSGRVNPKAGVSVIQHIEGTERHYKVVKNLQ